VPNVIAGAQVTLRELTTEQAAELLTDGTPRPFRDPDDVPWCAEYDVMQLWHDFNADPAQSYSVNVHVASPTNGLAAGTIVACGDLKAKKANGKTNPTHGGGKNKPKHAHPPQAQGPKQ